MLFVLGATLSLAVIYPLHLWSRRRQESRRALPIFRIVCREAHNED